MQAELIEFATWLEQHCNLAPSSINAYCRDMTNYLNTGLEIDAWLVQGEVSASRSNQRAAALKAFCSFLGMDAPQIRYRRPEPEPIPYVTVNQVEVWLKQLLMIGAREYAGATLMYGSGLRVGEVVGAQLDKLDLDQGMLSVFGKGRKWRSVPLADHTIKALEYYLRTQRPKLALENSPGLVFLGDMGGMYLARRLADAVGESAILAGLPALKRPCHELRHMCATHMLEGGAPDRVLQDLLGHDSPKMTNRYAQVSPKLRLGAYNKAHPWGVTQQQMQEVG